MEFAIFIVIMIVVSLVAKAKQRSAKPGEPNARVQKLIERLQAQQGFNQPTQLQHSVQFQPPAPYQPAAQVQPPAQWLPSYGPPQGHRPPQNNLPTPRRDTDTRVIELMNARNEVAAIRLLCDEQDMGILEAQEYARALVAPADQKPPSPQTSQSDLESEPKSDPDPEGSETRYVGSAAFAESIFDLDREEDTWASGWVDTPEPDDRSDIDELWQTVRNPPRPGTTQPS
ncbi:hypothetical protein EV652_104218 [Kribbella steppae]|uniref:Ribosomal L7/L12-like protein n=1 Tax=Kribbella steppae TaxID=2512223 RepID=A0A4R2HN92_9ACTN|nr:hypothetical protein [Kribbella steppae]TCO32612.1 hypothetical protein EV652_104218 [Kribbella steppae]